MHLHLKIQQFLLSTKSLQRTMYLNIDSSIYIFLIIFVCICVILIKKHCCHSISIRSKTSPKMELKKKLILHLSTPLGTVPTRKGLPVRFESRRLDVDVSPRVLRVSAVVVVLLLSALLLLLALLRQVQSVLQLCQRAASRSQRKEGRGSTQPFTITHPLQLNVLT